MKKILLITLISAVAGSALVSCDNGAYSATPDGGGGSTSSGSIDGKFNGTYRKYTPATWYDTMSMRGMGGVMMDNGTVKGTISLGIAGYSGANTYTTGSGLTSVSTTVLGANNVPSAVYIAGSGMGRASITVSGESNNKMTGTYNAVMYRSYPSMDMNDSVVITEGTFNVPKK